MNSERPATETIHICVSCKRVAWGSTRCTRTAPAYPGQLIDTGDHFGLAATCVRCCGHNHG